ncbi:hypothetical protein J4E90_007239 [Alternaria incomplexa]|uniref:uncharacterized protein n=1 Tax=Alternaria incomplexa TaxID=1187928 RepID=UPI0022203DA3|nr:uncharacterized protein J4E90_007239 [Alternaria incomplexa]KAI4910982.1 hypothetical protein J4E90_007239 [Alternaria incomplexa]
MARFLGLRGRSLASAISITCGLCFLCFGYAQGVMGGLLTVQQFLDRFPQVDIVNQSSFHNAWVTGLTVGTWHLGCIVSAIATIFVGDLLGRRRTLILGLTFWVIGEIIQTSSYSFPQFIVGRAIAGFGNGFTTSTAPAYQAECVKSHRKGTILMISAGAFVSAGIALSYWFVFGFAYLTSSSASWRVPIALQIMFALPAIAMLFVLPESPRWLILTGREQEALTVLAALNDDEPDSFETKDEFLQIKDAILIMAQGSSAGLFSNKERRGFHRVVLAYFVQVFQQGTGINLVLQYLSWIFLTRMSFEGWLARLLASCSATVYFLASFIVVVGIDRFWGRRSLMMFGASGMSVCMILITILQYLWSERNMQAGRIASTVFLFIFSVFFAIGWQGMAWLYQVEIVPLRIRGPANGLSTSANWLLNFVIVFITPIAFQRISYRTWIIFAVTNFAIIPLVYFFYPETAFRSLEEVDVIFQLAHDAPGNPWLTAVGFSQSEPLWFGKKDPEKRLNFNYGNSSWHKRLVESVLSRDSGSGSNTNSGNTEKRPWSNGESPDSGETAAATIPRGRKRSEESPVDPRLHLSPPSSPTTTMTTTITSTNRPRRKLQKRNSSASSLASHASRSQPPPPVFGLYNRSAETHQPTMPHHRHTRSTSTDSLHSVRPEWWTEDLAPAPVSTRSRSSSRPGSAIEAVETRGRPASRVSTRSVSNNALNRFVNPDLLAQQQQQRQQPQRAASHSSLHQQFADHGFEPVVGRDSVDYPGMLGGEEHGRGRSGVVRTESERETYLPDGVYEVVEGRVRQLSAGPVRPDSVGSSRRYSARDAGYAR